VSQGKINVGRKTLTSLLSVHMITVFGLVSLIFVKRFYGYEILGMIAFSMSFVSLYSIIFEFGVSSAYTRKINDVSTDKGEFNTTYVGLKTVLSFLMLISTFASIFLIEYFTGTKFNTLLKYILYLIIIKYFVDNHISTVKHLFGAQTERAKIAVPTVLGRFLQMFFKCSVCVLGLLSLYLIAMEILASLLILIFMLYLARNYPFGEFRYVHMSNLLKVGFLFMVIAFGNLALERVDKLMIQLFIGTPAVGVYWLGQRIASLSLVLSATLTAILFPLYSEWFGARDYNRIETASNKAIRFVSLFIIPLILLVLFFSEQILVFLFGSDAYQSAQILRVLIIATYILSISQPFGILLTIWDIKKVIIVNLSSLVFNVLLNLVFIPDSLLGIQTLGLGLIGAAWAYLATIFFRLILLNVFLSKVSSIKFYYGIITHVYSGFIAIIFFYNSSHFLPVYFSPFSFVFSCIIYFLVLYVHGEFTKRDIDFVVSLTNPYKMKTYIQQELSK